MSRLLLIINLIFLFVLSRFTAWATLHREAYVFIENKGQLTDQFGVARTDIDAKMTSGGVQVFIGAGQVHYQWSKPAATVRPAGEGPADMLLYRMDVRLVGANTQAVLHMQEEQTYFERYFLSHCGPEGIRAASYRKMVYKDVYPSIDWVLYIKDNTVEYDFVVRPGGRVSDIRLRYEGADGIRVQEDGSWMAHTPLGSVREVAPVSFQANGQPVASRFVLDKGELTFHTAAYEGTLIIDPKLVWASYFGSNSGFYDDLYDVTINRYDEMYACGMTTNINNIATTGAYQTVYGGNVDGMLIKFDSLQQLAWCTYYGAAASEYIQSVEADASGDVYIAGKIIGAADPVLVTQGAHQTIAGGGNNDIFFGKFKRDGSRVFASFYGGAGKEYNPKLEVAEGSIYLVGATNSTDGIATPGSYQPALAGGWDAFLAKFNLDGVRQWGTYYGGPLDEPQHGNCLKSDGQGNLYIAGRTKSTTGIATAGCHQPQLGGGIDNFVAKFNQDGLRQWATYYGGPDDENIEESGRKLAVDNAGNVYFTATTPSATDIATGSTHQSAIGGLSDAFLVKFNKDGVRQWATYFGGPAMEMLSSVLCVDSNSIYLSGSTASTSQIATADALQPAFGGGVAFGDVYLARFHHDGTLSYGSYYGGSGFESSLALGKDSKGYIFLVGMTNSTSGIATPDSYKDTYPGALGWNTFLARFCFAATPDLFPIQGPDSVCRYSSQTYTVSPLQDVDAYIWDIPEGWSGGSTDNSIVLGNNGADEGVLSVRVVRCGDTSMLQTKVVYMASDKPVISVDGFNLSTSKPFRSYQWCLNGAPIPGATEAHYRLTENGDYTVITIGDAGCIDTSAIYTVNNVSLEDRHNAAFVHIYPNPATDILYIDGAQDVTIAVYSLDGRELIRTANTGMLNLRQLRPGVYLVRLAGANGATQLTRKIVKGK